jgi:Kef-type K+ transport system membrane component KefB
MIVITLPAASSAIAAAAEAAGGMDVITRLFWILPIMLLAGKFSGELFERMHQPAVLGELIVGALLGTSALGVIPTAAGDQTAEIIRVLAELGVVVLLFEVGVETDIKQMMRVGVGAFSVAAVGVILPFGLGFVYWMSPLVTERFNVVSNLTTAIFVGATLTATSVGITARVLTDLRALRSIEGQLVVGAAVIDDVMGLVILGIVTGLVGGSQVGLYEVGRSVVIASGFLVASLVLGFALAPRIFALIDRMRVRGVLLVSAFAFALIVASLANMVGLAFIVGAYAAGLILSGTNQFDVIHERIKPVSDIFTPIFFLSIGAQVDLRLLNPAEPQNRPVLAIGLVLLLIAVIGKFAAGYAVFWKRYNRVAVGVGMIPRGEVGLIFANIGLLSGVLSSEVFSAILLMVAGTTFVTPPALKWVFARWGTTNPTLDDVEPEAA